MLNADDDEDDRDEDEQEAETSNVQNDTVEKVSHHSACAHVAYDGSLMH